MLEIRSISLGNIRGKKNPELEYYVTHIIQVLLAVDMQGKRFTLILYISNSVVGENRVLSFCVIRNKKLTHGTGETFVKKDCATGDAAAYSAK